MILRKDGALCSFIVMTVCTSMNKQSSIRSVHPYERKMKQQNVVAAKPLDKNGWNFIGNTIGISNEVFASYDVFYNEVHYKNYEFLAES